MANELTSFSANRRPQATLEHDRSGAVPRTGLILSCTPLGFRAAPDREEELGPFRTIVALLRRGLCSSLCLFHKISRILTPVDEVRSPLGDKGEHCHDRRDISERGAQQREGGKPQRDDAA
jgi:hypothetical protein